MSAVVNEQAMRAILAPRIVTPTGRDARTVAAENNWYEGSRWSPNRSWVWFPLQDARRDLDRFTRYELNKHARYLYKNSPFIRGLIRRIVTLCVGSGFHPVFKSVKNPAWAKLMNRLFARKSRNVHLGHKASFSQWQRFMGRARFLDGECFAIKTFDEESFENRVQGVEADRCSAMSGDTRAENGNPGTVDGVNINRQGTPTSYQFRGVTSPYDAIDVVHHYTPDRPGQYRGETILASAINTARDVDDILALEKQCVKDASSKQDIIKTQSGSLDPEMFRTLRYGQGTTGSFPTIFSLPVDDRTRDDQYRIKFGAQPIVLNPGDEYTPYKPDRPGSAWQGFMDFMAATICISTELPPSVLLQIQAGGTDVRRDLDIAQRVVEPWQGDMVIELEDELLYLMQGEIVESKPPDDFYIAWHFPPKMNVDRQQQAQDRADCMAGLMSWEEFHGRYGDDGDGYEQTIIDEAKRRRDRIKTAGFKTVKEFVEVMSFDPKLFVGNDTPDAGGDKKKGANEN
jgi:hypothetical protein